MEPPDNEASSDPRCRRLRKGTTSCWDCKKRKVKCTFDAASETVCSACRRRGAPCISQDRPEEEFQAHAESNNGELLLQRIQRVEALLEQLIEAGHTAERDVGRDVTPSKRRQGAHEDSDYESCDSFNPPPESCVATTNSTLPMTDEWRALSKELVRSFPSQEDIDVFCKSDYVATFYCYQIFTNSGDHPESEAFDFVNEFAKIPDPSTTPPVLVAKRMIIFALVLQYFRSQHTFSLSEKPSAIMERLVDTAVHLVTTNEKIVACIEGLECIILEGIFQSNEGNLRRAWLAFRKVMVIAQLMKIDHPNPSPVKSLDAHAKASPKFMWFRIVYMDSYLSLMLGLSHGGQETNMENDVPGETLSCKLERAHTLIARRIIDRNRRDSFFQNIATTQELDKELLNVAKALPDKFWLPPNFTSLQPNTREAFWETMRLCDQFHHYNLVHLLHLPYLLSCDKESSYYTYSKISCVNASREIINRFIAFRNFNRHMLTVYCRTADFFALMAGMTILLAHIDSHRLEVADWRAHQRLGDLAMIEQLLDSLEKMGNHTNDTLTCKSAEQLRSLVDIESSTAHGRGQTAQSTLSSLEKHSGELQLSIPYFGIIKIGCEGITKDSPTDQASSLTSMPDAQPVRAPPQMAFASVNAEPTPPQSQLLYPELAASVNDWTFQGVDAAFFDSLMRGNVDWV